MPKPEDKAGDKPTVEAKPEAKNGNIKAAEVAEIKATLGKLGLPQSLLGKWVSASRSRRQMCDELAAWMATLPRRKEK